MSLYPSGRVTSTPMSFETGEQAIVKIYFPIFAKVTKVRATVVKAVAGTDAGTITVKNAAGATLGTITVPLSTAINTEFSVAFEHEVEADSFISLTAAKTTAGGKLICFVES